MDTVNQTLFPGFILLGFSVSSQMRIVLFVLFLIMYIVTVSANGLIIAVSQADIRLHSPMYFFICNLAFLDACFLSTNIPKCLEGFLFEWNTITYSGCVTQMYVSVSLGATQCILLAVMAWDRYVAICNPLRYQCIMNKTFCIKLAFSTWAGGFIMSVVFVLFTMTVPLCGHNKINHVACEVIAVLRLACTDIHVSELVFIAVCMVVLVAPLSLIFFSYLHIISTILRIPTAAGRQKAFSTCGSHLAVVILFYGTIMVMYMRPRSLISTEHEKVFSVFYGLLTPALNPLIYTLRNKDVKGALKRLLTRRMAIRGFHGHM